MADSTGAAATEGGSEAEGSPGDPGPSGGAGHPRLRPADRAVLVAVLHFLSHEDDPRRIVRTLGDALPPGSYLVASHATAEHNPEGLSGAGRAYSQGSMRGAIRTSEESDELAFSGLELVDPGVVLVSEWRPEESIRPLPSEVNAYGWVATKP